MSAPRGGIEFTVEWLGADGEVIEETSVHKGNLTNAVKWAAGQLVRAASGSADAHGFFVVASAEREEEA